MTVSNPKLIYFPNVDALRFLAFLGVFFSHTIRFSPINDFYGLLLNVATLNYLGVPFFFTLSSFLITYKLLTQKHITGEFNLFIFYKNRTLRIWPAYFLVVLICFGGGYLLNQFLDGPFITLPSLWPFLFFYVNFFIISYGAAFTFALSILWSISIEEQFYIVWGMVLKIISENNLDKIIVILFLSSIVFSYVYLRIWHKPANNLLIHTLYITQNFCTGAFMALVCVQKQKLFSILQHASGGVIASAYLVLPAAYIFITDLVLQNIIKSICFSVILYDQTFNEKRLFNTGRIWLVNYLGKISYGLYLYHAMVFVALQKLFDFFSASSPQRVLNNIFEIVITLLLTIIIAHLSYKFIEQRFLRLKTKE